MRLGYDLGVMEEVIRAVKVEPIPDGKQVRHYLALFLGVLVISLANLCSLIAHRRNVETLRDRELSQLARVAQALARPALPSKKLDLVDGSTLVPDEPELSNAEEAEVLADEIRAFRERWALASAGACPGAFVVLRDSEGKRIFDTRLADQAPDLIFSLAGQENATRALRELNSWSGELLDDNGAANLAAIAFDPQGRRIAVAVSVDEVERLVVRELAPTRRWLLGFGLLLLPLALIAMAIIMSRPAEER
ncbi:MAG: hypothetical protein V3W41_08160 [Planctomycetota bacterium]